MAKTIEELDTYSLEEIASHVGNEIDLQSLAQVLDIRTIPSIRKRIEKRECVDGEWCNFKSPNLFKLYHHNHNNHQSVQCKLCLPGKPYFNGIYHLRRHQNAVHHISKGFECMNCNKQYYWKSSLNRHRKLCKL